MFTYNKPMGRPPEDNLRKVKIIELAIKKLFKDGAESLSFQKLADELDISQTTVIHYLKSKKAMYRLMAQYVSEHNIDYVTKKLDHKNPALTNLKNYLFTNFQWAEEFPSYASTLIFYNTLAINHAEYQDDYNKRLHQVRNRIEGFIYSAVREKSLHLEEQDIPLLATLIHNFLVSSISNYLCSANSKEKALFKARAQLLLNKFSGD